MSVEYKENGSEYTLNVIQILVLKVFSTTNT
jgi:hypothetical protein